MNTTDDGYFYKRLVATCESENKHPSVFAEMFPAEVCDFPSIQTRTGGLMITMMLMRKVQAKTDYS
jgi:hypothetical protein